MIEVTALARRLCWLLFGWFRASRWSTLSSWRSTAPTSTAVVDLTHEAMRGPSAWSIGDRELMAAFVSKVNESQFCIAAHPATSGLWYGDHEKVVATLAEVENRADRRAAPGDASHAGQAHARPQY